MSSVFTRDLLRRHAAARYWPVWLGLGAMKLMAALPHRLQLALGRGLGRLYGRLDRHRRHVVATNLRLCFPALDEAARARLARAHFEALGMGIFEVASGYWAPRARLAALGEVCGLEHFDAAAARGRGIILMTGHFTTLEIGAGLLALHRSFHPMQRRNENALFNEVMSAERARRTGGACIDRGDLRGMLRVLRRNGAVWYAPDQDYGAQGTVFVPFFGVAARTITATSRLARMSGAAVLPYWPERLADGRYRVHILPMLEDFPSADETADAARINRLIEDWARCVPEQYYWVHRRFKGRPAGEPPVY